MIWRGVLLPTSTRSQWVPPYPGAHRQRVQLFGSVYPLFWHWSFVLQTSKMAELGDKDLLPQYRVLSIFESLKDSPIRFPIVRWYLASFVSMAHLKIDMILKIFYNSLQIPIAAELGRRIMHQWSEVILKTFIFRKKSFSYRHSHIVTRLGISFEKVVLHPLKQFFIKISLR